jgi:hypothetical protein
VQDGAGVDRRQRELRLAVGRPDELAAGVGAQLDGDLGVDDPAALVVDDDRQPEVRVADRGSQAGIR